MADCDATGAGPAAPSRDQVWSKYWRQGALHSLSGSFAGNYEGSIRRFWIERFSTLQATHRVLDVGTGNGPLPALICELELPAMPRVDAIDVAAIDPAWLAAAPARCGEAIHFHPSTSVEQLPFEDAGFDHVVSQYGLEYASPERALPEIARVLKPAGTLGVIVHHAGSRLADVAREEARLGEWLLSEARLLATASEVAPYMAMAARGEREALAADPGAGAARTAYNGAMQALAAKAEGSAYPDLLVDARDFVGARIQGLLQRAAPLEQALEAFSGYEEALHDAIFRNRELVQHALDEAGVDAFTTLMSANGLQGSRAEPIFHGEHLVGWTICGVRAG